MSGLLEEFNRQIKDETSRKSFAARLGIYNWTDVTNAFSIELDLVLIPSIENLKSRTYPEEDVDNMGPVDIGIARSKMNKVLSSIINKNYGVCID
jgi:hypothetical protein